MDFLFPITVDKCVDPNCKRNKAGADVAGADQNRRNGWMAMRDTKGGAGPGLQLNEEQLRNILRSCDEDGDGRLSKQELRNAFVRLSSRNPCWRTYRAMAHADADKDGYISEGREMDDLVEYILSLGYTL